MESKPVGDFRFRPLVKVRLLVLLSFFSGLSQTLLAATPGVEGRWGPRIKFTTVPISAAVLPNGKLLIFSSWDRFDFTTGTGARDKTYSDLFDPATGKVTEFLVTRTNHDMFCPGTALLEDGRLLVNGGGPHVTTTSLYDFNRHQWVRGASMSRRRWYNASTTLPGGGVFTLGGIQDDGVGELWTSGAGWSVLAGAPVRPMTVDAGSYMPRSEQHPKLLVAPSGKLFAAGPTPNMQWYDTASGGYGNESSGGWIPLPAAPGRLVQWPDRRLPVLCEHEWRELGDAGGAGDVCQHAGREDGDLQRHAQHRAQRRAAQPAADGYEPGEPDPCGGDGHQSRHRRERSERGHAELQRHGSAGGVIDQCRHGGHHRHREHGRHLDRDRDGQRREGRHSFHQLRPADQRCIGAGSDRLAAEDGRHPSELHGGAARRQPEVLVVVWRRYASHGAGRDGGRDPYVRSTRTLRGDGDRDGRCRRKCRAGIRSGGAPSLDGNAADGIDEHRL